jgi:tetratricopeptide (TPR) repeat protein
VKAGRDIPVELTLTPGDGKRLTFDEIKAGGGGSANPPAASGGGGKPSGESAAEKAKREEIEKKNLEIEAKNKKITESNEIIARTFKTGNEALTAAGTAAKSNNSEDAISKYTAAIAAYDEGLAADADQPAILTNKAVALKGRGVERFNSAVRSKTLDDAGKAALLGTAKDDFKAAAETSSKAVTLIKAQPVPTEAAELQRYNGNKYAAMLTNAESMRLYVSKADQSQADAGLAAFRDYIGIETDPAKKAKAQLDMAQMLLDSGQADKALTEFKAILAATPDSPEANLGAGLAVYAAGDKAKFQEAANFLQKFVEVAPDTNPMKNDAKAILTELKNSENVTPEKTSKPPRKRP